MKYQIPPRLFGCLRCSPDAERQLQAGSNIPRQSRRHTHLSRCRLLGLKQKMARTFVWKNYSKNTKVLFWSILCSWIWTRLSEWTH
jgi:hypothetical protein